MADHLGGGEIAELAAEAQRHAAREPEEEAGGEEVAGAGRIDDRLDRVCRHGLDRCRRVTTSEPSAPTVTAASLPSRRTAASAASKSPVS